MIEEVPSRKVSAYRLETSLLLPRPETPGIAHSWSSAPHGALGRPFLLGCEETTPEMAVPAGREEEQALMEIKWPGQSLFLPLQQCGMESRTIHLGLFELPIPVSSWSAAISLHTEVREVLPSCALLSVSITRHFSSSLWVLTALEKQHIQSIFPIIPVYTKKLLTTVSAPSRNELQRKNMTSRLMFLQPDPASRTWGDALL